MYTIVSLELLRLHLGLASADNSEDARLLRCIEAASLALERQTNRRFLPRVASIPHNFESASEISLGEDLLELQSLTNGDGSPITLDAVLQSSDGALRLQNGAVFTYTESPHAALTVTGIWGYHPDWGNAWANSGDSVQNNPLSASATSLSVSDADAGNPPRFQVGQLLKIESEYLYVIAIDTSTNILTVERGANGTTAAAHNQTTPIFSYQVPQDIAALVLRWALWLYREADEGFSDFPPALADSLHLLRRIRV